MNQPADIARLQEQTKNLEAWVTDFHQEFKDFREDQHRANEHLNGQLHGIDLRLVELAAQRDQAPPSPPTAAKVTGAMDLVAHWSGRGSRVGGLLVVLYLLKIVSFDIDFGRLNAAMDAYSRLGKAGLLPDATPVQPTAPLVTDE